MRYTRVWATLAALTFFNLAGVSGWAQQTAPAEITTVANNVSPAGLQPATAAAPAAVAPAAETAAVSQPAASTVQHREYRRHRMWLVAAVVATAVLIVAAAIILHHHDSCPAGSMSCTNTGY